MLMAVDLDPEPMFMLWGQSTRMCEVYTSKESHAFITLFRTYCVLRRCDWAS